MVFEAFGLGHWNGWRYPGHVVALEGCLAFVP
jgi:hypothetical protein